MSRSRAILSFSVLAGSLALGCAREAEPQPSEVARTTGQEEPLVAQPTAPEPPSPVEPQIAERALVSDAEIHSFAEVIVRLAQLEQEAAARVDAGQPPDQVSAELQPQVAGVFTGTTLSADRFKEIADQAEHDPALRQRIEAQLQQRVLEAPPV